MCIDKLTRLGFSEKEAQVYLTLFRIGPSPVGALAKRLGYKRATVYALLEALARRELVSSVDTDQGRRYVPQSPETLLDRFEAERTELQTKMEMAKDCVRELDKPANGNPGDVRRVKFHEGMQSVVKGLEEYFLSRGPLFALIAPVAFDELHHCLQGLFQERRSRRLTTFQEVIKNGPFSAGSLLVHGDSVAFLTHSEAPELTLIHDPIYARYVGEVLFTPYFGKSMGSSTKMKRSPVKG